MVKKNILIAMVLLSIFMMGCGVEKPIGGDRDEHGCLGTVGYTWCESKQKCLRIWEEDCPEAAPEEESGLTPDECIEEGGRTVNIVGGEGCNEDEINMGQVIGFISPNICCVPGEWEKLTIEEAMEIAQDSECTEKGSLTEEHMYNDFSRTWWIDLKMKPEFENEMCYPACVVFEETKEVEINWRCTGALPPE